MTGFRFGGAIAAVFFTVAAATTLAVAPAHAQSQVSIGYIPSGDFLPAYVATDKGFFKDAGIDARMVAVPLATNVPAAIVSGSIQIGMTTTPIMFQAKESGVDLVAISGLSWDTRKNPQLSIVVRKDGGIASAKDLVGKKIAFPGLRSLFDSAAAQWLVSKGVDPKQVMFIEAQMPQLADLLKSGNVDAIALLDPFRAKAIADGVGVKLTDFLVDMQDDQPLAYWMTMRDYAMAHPKELKAFRDGIAQALAFIEKNPDDARQIGAKYLRGNILVNFPNWKMELTAADMKFETDMQQKAGILQQAPDLANSIVK